MAGIARHDGGGWSQSVASLVSIFLQVSAAAWKRPCPLNPTKLEIAPLQNSLPLLFFFTGRMSDTSSTPNSELEEQWHRWVDAALPDDDSPPPLHADPARRRLIRNANISTLLNNSPSAAAPKTPSRRAPL